MNERVEVSCARCGSDDRRPWEQIDGWRLVDCGSCGLRFVSPRQDSAAYATLYDSAYFKSTDSLTKGYEDYAGERESILRTFRRRWQRILGHVPPAGAKRSLDVGCALGFGLEVAREHGFSPFGVDISAHAVAEGKARGLSVTQGDAGTAERTFGGPMGVVTSWDVIEHLPDPVAHLATLARMTEVGGILSLITPDRGSLPARALGRRWVEYQKPEEHIYFFRRADVVSLLARTGFEPVEWSTAGKYVPLRFALDRLGTYSSVFAAAGRSLGRFGAQTVYVDPLDKLHVVARRRRD